MPTKEELLKKAQALSTEKKYSEVIELLPYDLLEKLNDADLYAEKAQAYYRIKEKDLYKIAVERALDINPNLAKANHYKGNIYIDVGKYDEAIRFYNKAIECDPKYANPYNGLGHAYLYLQEYTKAIEYFKKAILYDPYGEYTYRGLGIVYYKYREYDKAIEYFSKAIELDPRFDSPYYYRALVYIARCEYLNALNDFKKNIELRKDKSGYISLHIQSKIEELKKLITNSDYNQISILINRIKDLLLFTDSFVTHYTSLTAAKVMILEESKFRLSECAFLNDSSEGRELFKFLEIDAPTRKSEENCPMPFIRKPFIGSFVSDSKHNNLTLWRLYGKENKEEAKGCSITIDSKKLQVSLRDTIASKSKIDTNQMMGGDFNFYKMVYRTKDMSNPFVIPEAKDKEKELNNCMNKLVDTVNKYRVNNKKNLQNIEDLIDLLKSISFLFKSADYKDEHEIRMVVNGTGLEKNINSDSIPPRVYIETVPINPIIQKITLGPKVERAEEWAAAFYYELDKQGLHPEIFISHLPFK